MGDRYYYDYRGGGGARRGSTKWNFFFPFLLLILIGVTFVLAFQLFRVFFVSHEKDAVYMYVANGSASIKIWGTDEFSRAYSGTQILQGDEVKTSEDSRVVLKVFDGTLIRLSGDTYITFNEIYSDGGNNDVQIILNEGEVWVNKTQATSSGTKFILTVGSLNVTPVGTVFNVSKNADKEVVRVIYGAVSIDVNSQDGGTAVDHIDVDAGNEAVFDQERMTKFWAFQAPNVVTALAEDFKTTPWYAWNIGEDEAPTDFAISVIENELNSGLESDDNNDAEFNIEPEINVGTDPESNIGSDETDLGTVESSIISGDTSSSSFINYGPLTTPKVLTINGVSYTPEQLSAGVNVDVDVVKVSGEITGAEKIVVNYYTLQRFVPSSGKETFIYWANGKSSNMKAGENTYTVYGIASDGTKSPSTTFKLIYTPKEPIPAVSESLNISSESASESTPETVPGPTSESSQE